MQYIEKVGDIFYFRRRVPPFARAVFKMREFRRSLLTKSQSIALSLATKLNSLLEEAFLTIRLHLPSPPQVQGLLPRLTVLKPQQ